MAMNEAAGFHRGGLTKQQKREAEAAIYGLQEQTRVANFTAEEIDRMRAIISQHDTGEGAPKEFDLNNPPKVPYTHQRFPKMTYDHVARTFKIVQNEAQLQEALHSGLQLQPYPAEPTEAPQLDAATLAEVAQIDAELKKKATKK